MFLSTSAFATHGWVNNTETNNITIPISIGGIVSVLHTNRVEDIPIDVLFPELKSEGVYYLAWDKINNASYYNVIVTNESGTQKIIKTSTNKYRLGGLELGLNVVAIQTCYNKSTCEPPAYYGEVTRHTKTNYHHTDMLGSSVAQTNEAGELISRSLYDPFGKRLGGDLEGIGYTGHFHDKDLGLTYMQARYYDPLIARFYSNDPVGFAGNSHSFNRYAYANNNPYKYVDPDGEFGIIGFFIGFFADMGAQKLTTGNIDFRQSVISGLVGAVTGGLSSVARTGVTASTSIAEKIVIKAALAGQSATVGGAGYAVNESLNDREVTLKGVGNNAALQFLGLGSASKKVVGTGSTVMQSFSAKASGKAYDLGSELVGETVSKTVDTALSNHISNLKTN